MSRVVEANEPNTLAFHFYLDRSETKSIVHEVYTNSEAVFVHSAGLASQASKDFSCRSGFQSYSSSIKTRGNTYGYRLV